MENENIINEETAEVMENEPRNGSAFETEAAERHRRAAYAARRREAERQQAIEEAVMKEREENRVQLERYKSLAAKAAEDEVMRELAKIREDDPAINTVEDLLNMPTAVQFKSHVNRGLSLSEAYYLANRKAIMENALLKAKQQAVSNVMSKSHLTATRSRTEGTKAVSADLMALYKTLNPTATAAQIERHYNDYLSK